MRKTSLDNLVSLSVAESEALIERMSTWSVPKEDLDLAIRSVKTMAVLSLELVKKNMTIRLIRKMLRMKTEKSRTILDPANLDGSTSDRPTDGESDDENNPTTPEASRQGPRARRKGHGRRAGSAYTGATTEYVRHETLAVGDRCPDCHRGNLYDTTGPGFIRVVGNPPFTATRHCPQKLRCATCGQEYEAPLPAVIARAREKNERYAPSARSTLVLLKYSSGFPLYRLAALQDMIGVPLSTSTQWDMVVHLFEVVYPVFQAMYRYAAEGTHFYIDDTFVRILKMPPPDQTGHDPKRTGLNTTGIVVKIRDIHITLYCSGRNHAGENLRGLLLHRPDDANLPVPIQIGDAASKNIPRDIATLVINCLVHGRRNFVNLLDIFPRQAEHVITQLAAVFHHDKIARKNGYSDQERLLFHQRKSKPVMDALKQWMIETLETKQVEPNSALGGAFAYMLRHWEKLTVFLSVAGAPIDSNIVERALKRAVLNRKNAYFYRTQHGALVGDVFMSLIETCRQNKVNPFHYLNTLQEYDEEVRAHPEKWLPFNYHEHAATRHQAA